MDFVSHSDDDSRRVFSGRGGTIVLGLLSFEILKRDLQQQFPDSDLDFVSHSYDDSRRVSSREGAVQIYIYKTWRPSRLFDGAMRWLQLV